MKEVSQLLTLLSLAAATLPCINGETLGEAIIKDMMPASSDFCSGVSGGGDSGSFSHDYEFQSSQEESQWYDDPVRNMPYGGPWSELEQYAFLAKFSHTDNNSNKTWTIRIGKGGNIYSMVGPMGETVAPQKRDDSPWIDEVWHSVTSDPPKNAESPFMIHGAGSYQSDASYTPDVGVPLHEVPFYSPSLGKFCNDEDGVCGFAAWAQHGPVATKWESSQLNFNRYKDCGNGIIEHTALVHNNIGDHGNWLARIDAPFGSVRTSVLKDVVLTSNNEEQVIQPVPRYDTSAIDVRAEDTLGYVIFAEDLPSPGLANPPNPGTSLTITQNGCRLAPDQYPYLAVRCQIEPTTVDSSGTLEPVTFSGTPSRVSTFQPLQGAVSSFKFLRYGSGTYCRPYGSAIMCRLDNVHINNLSFSAGDKSFIKFTNTVTGDSFTATDGVQNWSLYGGGLYSLIFTPRAGTDPTLQDIDAMISQNLAGDWDISYFNPPGAGGDVVASNGVIHWAIQLGDGTYWLYFYPNPVDGVSDMGDYVKHKFPPGSTIEIKVDMGMPEEENLAMAHVYGNSFPNRNPNWLTDGWPKLKLGTANEGAKPRDATIYNIITTANKNTQGGSHYYRQYFVMDRFSDISATAASLVDDVIQDNYNVNSIGDMYTIGRLPEGRNVTLFSSGTGVVGATVGTATSSSPCYGDSKEFVHPEDDNGNTIILQSRGNAGVTGHTERLGKCVLNVALQSGLTGIIKGGPKGQKLAFKFFTPDGVPTGDEFMVDGIRHWYWKANRMLMYPSAPYNTVEACPQAEVIMESMFPTGYYMNVTYASGHPENYDLVESQACTGSTTPKEDSKALFQVTCGDSTYIGSDPYHFSPIFPEDDFKRPYICNNDATARGEWTLLGYFPENSCSSIATGHVLDETMCAMT